VVINSTSVQNAITYIKDTIQNCTVISDVFGTLLLPLPYSNLSLGYDGKPYTVFMTDVDMTTHVVEILSGFHEYKIQCGHISQSDVFGFPFCKSSFTVESLYLMYTLKEKNANYVIFLHNGLARLDPPPPPITNLN